MPKVSVIIPAYNAESLLERSVRSALVQTEADLEVIVVDDGSSDATVDVAARIAEEDRRVRVLRNSENRGVSESRNRALALSSGEWVAPLDADDTWLPQRLEALLAASVGADVVCDDVLVVGASNSGAPPTEAVGLLRWVGLRCREPHWLTAAELIRYDLGLLKPLIRRDFLEGKQLSYDADLRVTEDYYLYFRLLTAGARWRQLAQGYYLYSRQADSLTSSPDAVTRQHVLTSTALLSDPAATVACGVSAALKRHHRHSRASLAMHTFRELARRREFLLMMDTIRDNPDYPQLVIGKIIRHMYMRVVRRIRGPRRPLPVRTIQS